MKKSFSSLDSGSAHAGVPDLTEGPGPLFAGGINHERLEDCTDHFRVRPIGDRSPDVLSDDGVPATAKRPGSAVKKRGSALIVRHRPSVARGRPFPILIFNHTNGRKILTYCIKDLLLLTPYFFTMKPGSNLEVLALWGGVAVAGLAAGFTPNTNEGITVRKTQHIRSTSATNEIVVVKTADSTHTDAIVEESSSVCDKGENLTTINPDQKNRR